MTVGVVDSVLDVYPYGYIGAAFQNPLKEFEEKGPQVLERYRQLEQLEEKDQRELKSTNDDDNEKEKDKTQIINKIVEEN